MKLPEVECVFDTSRSIYCLKPKGSHVGLSGDEIEEVARRSNNYEKLVKALKRYGDHEPCCVKGDACTCGFEQAIKEEKPK